MAVSALRAPQHPESEDFAAPSDEAVASWLSTAWPDLPPEFRHTRRVTLLKRILPAIGIALLLLVAMWPRLAPLWERMRFAFPAIDLREAGELRMVNPRYAGTDRLGRPFVVTAASGRQMPDRRDLMSLEKPQADLKTHGGADIVLNASTGVYQAQTQLLDLFGTVTLAHQNGTRFVTDQARIDVANNTAEGTDPVVGHGPSGDARGEGFRVIDKGDTIILTGKSDLLLRQAKAGSKQAALPVLPAVVAAEARPATPPRKAAPAVTHRNAAGPPAAHAGAHPAAAGRTPPTHQAPVRTAAADRKLR